MVATRRITIDDLPGLTLPEHWELVRGEIVAMTPAGGRPSRIGGRVYALFVEHGEKRGLGWAFPAETGFVLFDDRRTVRSPDAAFIVRDRLAAVPEEFIPTAPDLAVEVLSPSDRMADALAKVAMYPQAGVQIVWPVNPASETVTVFLTDAAPATRQMTDTLDGGDVLPGLTIPVAEIFT